MNVIARIITWQGNYTNFEHLLRLRCLTGNEVRRMSFVVGFKELCLFQRERIGQMAGSAACRSLYLKCAANKTLSIHIENVISE